MDRADSGWDVAAGLRAPLAAAFMRLQFVFSNHLGCVYLN